MAEPTSEQALPLALRAVRVRAARAVAAGRALAADRQDLEQEALLVLLPALPHFDASRASVRTYVECIADRSFATLFRRKRPPAIEHLDDDRFGTADGIPAVQLQIDFERILSPLDDPDRTLARLLADHRPTEISRMLGIPRSTVYTRIARLREAFRAAGYGPRISVGVRR